MVDDFHHVSKVSRFWSLVSMEDYTAALDSRTTLKELLLNDDWERYFRAGLRSKDAKLLEYLSSKEILGDMIEALVNEEGTLESERFFKKTNHCRTNAPRSLRSPWCSLNQLRPSECMSRNLLNGYLFFLNFSYRMHSLPIISLLSLPISTENWWIQEECISFFDYQVFSFKTELLKFSPMPLTHQHWLKN